MSKNLRRGFKGREERFEIKLDQSRQAIRKYILLHPSQELQVFADIGLGRYEIRGSDFRTCLLSQMQWLQDGMSRCNTEHRQGYQITYRFDWGRNRCFINFVSKS